MFENIKKHNLKVADCQKSLRTLNRYINDAENQLSFEIAKIVHIHRAASNHAGCRINMTALEHCVHFNNYRIHNPPAFLTFPDFFALKRSLDKTEAEALQRLTVLFETTTHSSKGD